ncbi:MAG: hypothetical protein EPO06_11260 [Burkholderiaceae bacterium]|nr:MAG: hypothetical protein EPO06_11260 [Burkholderiaceae bacterium]
MKQLASACRWAAVTLFFVSLLLPAYHAYEDIPGVWALFFGWLGLFAGHYSWVANPLLWISWFKYSKNDYQPALAMALIAFAFSLTFLLADTIPVGSSGPSSYKALSGYYLWVLSISMTAFSAAIKLYFEFGGIEIEGEVFDAQKHFTHSEYFLFAVLVAVPLFFSAGPLLKEKYDTDMRFAQQCSTAIENIIQIPKNVEGIYLDQDGGLMFDGIIDGAYNSRSSSLLGEPLVNNGFLRFYESQARSNPKIIGIQVDYRRYDLDEKEKPVANLLSQYGVFRSQLTNPSNEKLGITGFELVVKNLKTNEITATFRYFHNEKSRRVCGHQVGGRLSEAEFIRRAFGLQQRFSYLERGQLKQPMTINNQ